MTVKVRVVEKGVDRIEVVLALMLCASYRTECTLPWRLTGRESRNRPNVAIQALYRLFFPLLGGVLAPLILNDV